MNEGNGIFQRKQSIFFPNSDGYYIGIWRYTPADLNEDARIDLFLAGCCGGGTSTGPDDWQTINAFNSVWLSDGKNLPRSTGQKMGEGSTEAVDLGDVDGDGDMDAFVYVSRVSSSVQVTFAQNADGPINLELSCF